jgi:hypothetical protein
MEKNISKKDNKQNESELIDEYMLSLMQSINEGIFLLIL